MKRQATQPAAVPTGRKRRRASTKKNEEQKAKELQTKATQPPTTGAITWSLLMCSTLESIHSRKELFLEQAFPRN